MRIFVLADACELANCAFLTFIFVPKGEREAGVAVEYFSKLERRGSRRLGQKALLHRVSYPTDPLFGV